ncbi:effector-associated constant component EACC1 [Caballeronia telluris]|uniref:Uncharacterized protein n=1 Tax=Caballeronia telluris TaxID=326475 RepID=A0A158KJ34_9BURK|nr:hypothetical protein [Caballeronia telluris]SAL80580.1 hypothetical protein AWB66_06276 [Caballeronia telluris]
MDKEHYRFVVAGEDQAAAGRASQALADMLRELEPVLDVDRQKADEATMDLGTIVNAIATSGATLAIAQGLAGWLRARKGASITIEVDPSVGSVKAVVAGVDAEAAVRIAEIIRS